ncbi:MAG TPA: hypothetical protein VFR18_25465 [Terriglobia bacterium]|nr:hypothetical protein [Terriglobia bacterium]
MRRMAIVIVMLVVAIEIFAQVRGPAPAGGEAAGGGAQRGGAPAGGALPGGGGAQRGGPPGGGRGGGARGGRAGAPFDMTGYWVSVVGEDWRWRVFPTRGDYGAVPLNQAARQIADAWDPAKDAAGGEACKAFAAPSLMRIPGRLHITWQDDQTLKIETDSGKQTRLFYFGNPPENKVEDFQGTSKAEWDLGNAGAGGLFFGRGNAAAGPSGSLKVVTSRMKPGYATRNGIPFSNTAILTEYYDLVKQKSGVEYLILTATLDDPTYMSQPMWTATHFKKQGDATNFTPVSCDGK